MYNMAVRAEGTDIAPEWTSLRAVYPNPSSELVVFLHGLIESEQWWFPRDHPNFGTRLTADLGDGARAVAGASDRTEPDRSLDGRPAEA